MVKKIVTFSDVLTNALFRKIAGQNVSIFNSKLNYGLFIVYLIIVN